MMPVLYRAWIPQTTELEPIMLYQDGAHGSAENLYGFLKRVGANAFGKYVLMSWTDKLDKHKRKIYEGDIMRHLETLVVVIWIDGEFRMVGKGGYSMKYSMNLSAKITSQFEIVGNVYESKHLLESLYGYI